MKITQEVNLTEQSSASRLRDDVVLSCVACGESHAGKGGHGEATISLYDAFRSGARGQKKKNLVTVPIFYLPTGKRKRDSWVLKGMQQFAPSIEKYSVR